MINWVSSITHIENQSIFQRLRRYQQNLREPQSSQTDALAPPEQQLLFPKVLMVELPWEIPQNLSLDQVSFMTIQESNVFDWKEESIGELSKILDKDFPMLKHVSMSEVLLTELHLTKLSKLNMKSLYLQSCRMYSLHRFFLYWALFERLERLHITVSPTDRIGAVLPKSLEVFAFHGCHKGHSEEVFVYHFCGSECDKLKSM